MALLPIQLLGAPVLRQEAAPVEVVTDEIRRLIRDMFETMYHAEGVGLAAPQVGVSKRVFVADVPGDDETRDVHALVNPVIVESSERTAKEAEGCLSLPGFEETVARPSTVVVEALSPDGDGVRIAAEGLLARVLQHEVDHLNGVLFIDRISPFKRGILLKKWRKERDRTPAD